MSTSNQTDDGKPKLSNEQKQKLKKYAVFALMGIICAGSMWLAAIRLIICTHTLHF